MRISKKINLNKLLFNLIIVLIWLKIFFSYLTVRLHYFQRHLTPNDQAFNFLGVPPDFSNSVELVLLPLLLLYLVFNNKFIGKLKLLILITFFMLGINIITGIINNINLIDSVNYSLKIFSPFYFFCAIITYHNKYKITIKKFLLSTVIFCLALTLIGIIFFNPSYNRFQNYLPIYFDSIHTHSYILLSVFIAIGYLIYRQNHKILLIGYLIISFLFLFLGYDVRTSLIMYLIFCITMLFLVSDVFKVLFIKLLVFVPLIVLLLFLIKIDVNQFSSGRTSMYTEKFDLLSTYTITDWMFGRGFGSDLIKTDVWWWDKKGSHSDFLTFLVENGVIYLTILLLFLYKLMKLLKKSNIIYLSIICGMIFTCIISNGIMVRPLAGYVFYVVLGYIYININNKFNKVEASL